MKTSRILFGLVWIPGVILFLSTLSGRGAVGDASGLASRARGIEPGVSAGASATAVQGGWSARDTVKTNTFERIITNVIQVWMPSNQFVYECRTNWVHSYTTNVVEIRRTEWIDQYRTNWVTQKLTNEVAVTRYSTNVVTAYRTNVVTVPVTNWVTRMLTNEVVVTRYSTNPVTAYSTNVVSVQLTNLTTVWQTNWQTLNLTNWETVVLFKTNWLKQYFTNTVALEGTTNRAVTEQGPEAKPGPGPVVSESRPAGTKDVLVLEAFRSKPAAAGNQTGVKLRVSLAGDPALPLRVERWVVECEDRPVVFSAQEREFTRELSAGKYKVAVEARRDANHPPLYARAKLDVTPESVTLQK